MFIKIGDVDNECFVNLSSIETLYKRRSHYAQPTLHTVPGTLSVPQPINPVIQWEYYMRMKGQPHTDSPWNLTEDEYNRVVKALQSGGGELLFEG